MKVIVLSLAFATAAICATAAKPEALSGNLISAEEAVSSALKHTPGWSVEVELEKENGRMVYEVEIVPKKIKPVEILVDALTGEVLGKEEDVGLASLAKVPEENAIAAALKHTLGKSEKVELEVENCKLVYEVKIVTDENKTVEILVDASSGEVLGLDSEEADAK